MLRAPLPSPLDAAGHEQGRHSRSLSAGAPPPPSRLPRMSVLASVKLPSLRRSEPANAPPTTHKQPLLTLKLSSHSFLDCSVRDDASPQPLYTIRTVDMTTTVVRSDPWVKSSKTADIKWPKVVPAKGKGKNIPDGVLVKLQASRWKGGDSFLKPSASKNGSRKFNIPHYAHSLKWQKQGMAYWCTSSPVKGPIAVFDPPIDHLPGRLTVYETLHDKHETSPMLVHQVTDPQEWMLVQSPSSSTPAPGDSPPNASLQWRKIAHGEPLFRKISPATAQRSAPGSFDDSPVTPTSQDQMAKIVHGDPLYPRLHPGAKSVLSFSSSSDEDAGTCSEVTRTRSPSPSADSSIYPLSNTISTPSHSYIDPSFYSHQELPPPVPPLPSQYSSQARSSSPASIRSRNQRGLPVPPPPLHSAEGSRSRTSLHSGSVTTSSSFQRGEPSSSSINSADALLWKRRPSEPIITRSRSTSRPLPRTPTTPSAGTRTPVIRRVQSHNRISQVGIEKPWLVTSPPPLPPMPLTPATPRTPRTGRSLPPTPFDLALGRSEGAMHSSALSGPYPPRKSFESDDNAPRWVQAVLTAEPEASDSHTRQSFDQPPPAYSSIDFNHTSSQPWTRDL